MKVRIPIYMVATASKCIGEVEVELYDEIQEAAEKLLEDSDEYLSANISNDFELGDTEIEKIALSDFEFYKKNQEKNNDNKTT